MMKQMKKKTLLLFFHIIENVKPYSVLLNYKYVYDTVTKLPK